MSMAVAGVSAVGVGALTSLAGGIQGADAANKASGAMNRNSQDAIINARSLGTQALEEFKSYVPSMQAGLDKALSVQTQNVNRMQDLVSKINPALLSAGKQMKDLLDGKAAPVLKNLQDQRDRQKADMMNNLRQQLGPGAETSSVGQQAMQKFDADTANMMSGAQQSYLSQVSNLALNGGETLNAGMNAAVSHLTNVASQYGNIGAQEANITNNQSAEMMRGFGLNEESASKTAAGQAVMGQTLVGVGNSIGQAGGMIAGGALAGGNKDGLIDGGGANGMNSGNTSWTNAKANNWGSLGTNNQVASQNSWGNLGSVVSPPRQAGYGATNPPGAYLLPNSGAGTGTYTPPNFGYSVPKPPGQYAGD